MLASRLANHEGQELGGFRTVQHTQRFVVLTLMLALLAGCANGPGVFAYPAEREVAAAPLTAKWQQLAQNEGDPSEDDDFDDLFPSDDPLAMEEDYDPLETVNRFTFAINEAIDFMLLRPAAEVYRFLLPNLVQDSVRNFTRNLKAPVIWANDLFQGKDEKAATMAGRFLVNSTLGLGGLFDEPRPGAPRQIAKRCAVGREPIAALGLGLGHHPPRNADHRGAFGHVLGDHRIGADPGARADHDRTQDLCAGADDHPVAQCRMPLLIALALGIDRWRHSAKGHALIQGHIVANPRCLADYHPGAMVDKEAAADIRTRMNLDSGDDPRQIGYEHGEGSPTLAPDPMADPITEKSVKARIQQHNGNTRPRRRIALHCAVDVFSKALEHLAYPHDM